MSIQKAVTFLIDASQNTDLAAASLVRKFWSKLPLTEDDITTLAQRALAAELSQVSVGKKKGESKKDEPLEIYKKEESRELPQSYRPTPREQTTTIEVEPRVRQIPVKVIDVEVRVLYDTKYDIMGKRKSFVEFTIHDLNFSINRYQQQIDGHSRHLEVMKYTKERLTTLGKKSVSELAQGEQTRLARRLQAAIKRAPLGEAA